MEYSDQTLQITDLATLDGANYVIEDSEFKNCRLQGPAVVSLVRTSGEGGGVSIPNYESSTVVIVAEEGRELIPVGVVLIRDCNFEGSQFENVSFFGPSEQMEKLRTSLMANVPAADAE